MKIFEIKKEETLDDFLKAQKYSQFLQSWQWGELQMKNGLVIKRLSVERENKIIAVATLVKKKLGFGRNYYYCPRGPIFNTQHTTHNAQNEIEEFLFNEIKKNSKKDNSIFLRFEPLSQITNHKSRITKTIDLQPAKTLMLDLSKSEEELLSEMHQKTRYNIRLSQKKGVRVTEANLDEFKDFWKLMEDTSERDGFRIHSEGHYKKLFEINFVKIYFAKIENKIIAAGIFSFFGDTTTYMHGASSNEYRNLMSPFLLQWELVRKAKKDGYKYYDFYGIDENKWPGVTRFKKGFGGFEIDYLGTLDIVFNEVWYNMYRFLRKLRRMV